MAVLIATKTGTTSPNYYATQRHLDVCANGVRWQMVLNHASSRLEFYFSTNSGVSWTEYTARRIDGVATDKGADMRISTRPDGAERMVVIYVGFASPALVRVSFGIFKAAARTTWTWQAGAGNPGKIASVSFASDFWKHPAVEVIPAGGNWHVICFWSRLYQDRGRLYHNRLRFHDGEDTTYGNTDKEVHSRASTLHSRCSVGIRHLGDDDLLGESRPDFYAFWAVAGSGDPEPRTYMARWEFTADGWRMGDIRVMRQYSLHSGNLNASFTGKQWVGAVVPHNNTQDIDLCLMSPADISRSVVPVPDLNQGVIAAVGTSWDSSNGDIYVIAAGTSNRRLNWIRYNWAAKTWTGWTQFATTDQVQDDGISMKPGTRLGRIEFSYSRTNGANSEVKYEFLAVNLPPSRPTWKVEGGARDPAATLFLDWGPFIDPDNPTQVQFTLRKRVDGGSFLYWNGSTWVASATDLSSAATSLLLAASWATAGQTVSFEVRVGDGSSFSPYSEVLTFLASTPINPTITSPANGAVLTSPFMTLTYTVAEMRAFRVRVLDGTGATILHNEEGHWITASVADPYEIPYEFPNGTAFDITLETQNAQGAVSAVQKIDVTTNYNPPTVPTKIITTVPRLRLDVAITNPAPGGGQVATDYNRVVRINAVTLDEFVVADSVPPNSTFADWSAPHGIDWDYRIEAVGVNNAVAVSV